MSMDDAAPAEPEATEVERRGPPVDDLSTPESVLALMKDWVAGRRSWANLQGIDGYTPDVIAAMDAAEVEKLRHLHAALAAPPAPADEGRAIQIGDLFPPAGHRYYDADRIARLRAPLVDGCLGAVTSMDVLELLCDWLNMDKDLARYIDRHRSAAAEDTQP